MFGNAIYTSTTYYLDPTFEQVHSGMLTTSDNIRALIFQGALLIIAFAYLYLRKF